MAEGPRRNSALGAAPTARLGLTALAAAPFAPPNTLAVEISGGSPMTALRPRLAARALSVPSRALAQPQAQPPPQRPAQTPAVPQRPAQAQPQTGPRTSAGRSAGVSRLSSVGGIAEYRLANGLRVLLFRDAS